jgi:hypothetical protein
MTRVRHLLWIVLGCSAALYMLFQVKFEVQALEKQLKGLNAQIYANQQAIHVLKAEWSHLNDPNRLAELNGRYLQLQAVDPKQLARLQDIPARVAVPAEPEIAGLDALAPSTGSGGAVVAPVTRSTPRTTTRPVATAADAPRPTVASSILTTLIGFVREDKGRARQ